MSLLSNSQHPSQQLTKSPGMTIKCFQCCPLFRANCCDPSGSCGGGAGIACHWSGGIMELWVSGPPERPPRVWRRRATYPYRGQAASAMSSFFQTARAAWCTSTPTTVAGRPDQLALPTHRAITAVSGPAAWWGGDDVTRIVELRHSYPRRHGDTEGLPPRPRLQPAVWPDRQATKDNWQRPGGCIQLAYLGAQRVVLMRAASARCRRTTRVSRAAQPFAGQEGPAIAPGGASTGDWRSAGS